MTLLTPKIYTATTTINIDRAIPEVFKSQTAQVGSEIDAALFYRTRSEFIRSRALAERVPYAGLIAGRLLAEPQPSLLRRLLGARSDTAVASLDADGEAATGSSRAPDNGRPFR